MFEKKHKKFRWQRVSETEWQSRAERGAAVVGTIIYDKDAHSYSLTTSNSELSGTFTTLGNAKNAFRDYLHTQS